MMVLLDGEPSGKAGSLCKPFLRALILFFTSVCKMWVRIRSLKQGMKSVPCLGQGWSGFPLAFLPRLCYHMSMRKTFQYRIFPSKKQVKKLNETLEECRWLYNHLLECRKATYEQEGKSLSLY